MNARASLLVFGLAAALVPASTATPQPLLDVADLVRTRGAGRVDQGEGGGASGVLTLTPGTDGGPGTPTGPRSSGVSSAAGGGGPAPGAGPGQPRTASEASTTRSRRPSGSAPRSAGRRPVPATAR